jgi:hypothetical protein
MDIEILFVREVMRVNVAALPSAVRLQRGPFRNHPSSPFFSLSSQLRSPERTIFRAGG